MKTIFRIIKWLVVLVVVLAVAGVLARNFIARKAVETGVKQMTGFPLEIGAVDIGLLKSQLEVQNLKLMNPPEFHEKMFVDLPRFFVDYRLGSMLAMSPHINELVINLNEVVVIKNEKGETNAMKLKSVAAGSGGTQTAPKDEKKMPYRVDLVKIHVGTVRYLDYSRGKPSERKMTLNLDATYKDITETTDITKLVLVTVLSKAGIPDLSGLAGDLGKGLGNVTDAAGKAVQGVGENVGKATKGLTGIFKKK